MQFYDFMLVKHFFLVYSLFIVFKMNKKSEKYINNAII